MPYMPKLDPKRDLAGATPEALAKALFRRIEPLPRATGQPVVGDEVSAKEIPANEADNGVPHLRDGV